MGRKKKRPSRPWCWYCNRGFDDEKILIQHQKAKHFKCHICYKKLYTGPGLAIHCMQVHKEIVDKVPNALPQRNNIDIEIYGMEGIPVEDSKEHEKMKQGGQKDYDYDSPTESGGPSRPNMPTTSTMPGMVPGIPTMTGMMPGMPPMGFVPPMGGPPMGHMGAVPMGMGPAFLPPGVPIVAAMPQGAVIPSTTVQATVQAPPKPLFPAAVAQASSSSHMPVGADFKPIMSSVPRPTFPAYSGNNSPSTSGQPGSSTQGAAPILYHTGEASSSPQINNDAKRPRISESLSSSPSSKIMHPDEDLSLEEKRSQLPQYAMLVGGMFNFAVPGSGPLAMNGMPMMRPGVPLPPGIAGTPMGGMGTPPYAGQPVYSPRPSMPHMMGQGGSRPF